MGIPLAVLKYLSPARLAELRATAPGLQATLDRIERERQRKATIESLKKSVSDAVREQQKGIDGLIAVPEFDIEGGFPARAAVSATQLPFK